MLLNFFLFFCSYEASCFMFGLVITLHQRFKIVYVAFIIVCVLFKCFFWQLIILLWSFVCETNTQDPVWRICRVSSWKSFLLYIQVLLPQLEVPVFVSVNIILEKIRVKLWDNFEYLSPLKCINYTMIIILIYYYFLLHLCYLSNISYIYIRFLWNFYFAIA